MLILSKYKDYYDGVVGSMGVDKTLVYDRKTVVDDNYHKFPEPFTAKKSWDRNRRNSFRNVAMGHCMKKGSMYNANSPFIVGFCGKLYVGWKFYREINLNYVSLSHPNLITTITYDIDFVKKHVDYTTWYGNLQNDLDYISSYDPMELFRNLKTPIFIYDSDYDRKFIHRYGHKRNEVFITNPLLKDYEFYKKMDSFAAFQEVQMFLGGVLGTGEKEIIEIEDKYKIAQHGFDNKSFRRDKAKGKKRPQSSR